MDAGGNPVIGGVGPFPARGRQDDLCAAPDHQASALLQEREGPARLATDGATPFLSVAWPQKRVKGFVPPGTLENRDPFPESGPRRTGV